MKYNELKIAEPFRFEAGGEIPEVTVAYHCSEGGYREGMKVIWICHALTANSDAEDWWPGLVGPGKLLDPEKYFIICVNMLGSPYGSSGPASIDPRTGKPYLLSFPRVTVRDIIRASILVRKHLGIKKIDLLVGSSIGGFQAIEWSVMEPDVVAHALFMATAPKVPAYLTAYNEAQRMALEGDPAFLEGTDINAGKKALECARAIAIISYRSFDGFEATQEDPDPDFLFANRATTYQRHQGKKLADRFDAYSYRCLSYAVDSDNVGRGRGGVAEALKKVRADCTVISIDTDALFPPKVLEDLAAMLPKADYHRISSRFGHDGFLLESEQITAILKPILCRF